MIEKKNIEFKSPFPSFHNKTEHRVEIIFIRGLNHRTLNYTFDEYKSA